MGLHDVTGKASADERRDFMRRLLDDLRALERLQAEGLIETGIRRIGAEQELFLVDESRRPALLALDLLKDIDDPHFTTELGQFNLEINLDPMVFEGACLSRTQSELDRFLGKARAAARGRKADIVLTGILPTLRKSDLTLDSMTPDPRYFALNDALCALRGGAYELHIKGLDELIVKHGSVMLEACNASFQIHYQCNDKEFANLYNISQLVTGPVLAAAANAPLLFARQLWRETRIALFQQSVDTRASMDHLRERTPRVSFGGQWVKNSVLDLFQEDITRFRTVMTAPTAELSTALLDRGEMPKLKALCVHNGTVYRWNRACYGLTDGKPHLRIENRVLPAGPTPADQVANAAFWYGLIGGLAARHEDITQLIAFEDAKMNFGMAARLGLNAQYHWLNGETRPAVNLICDTLLPLAKDGLARSGIDEQDAERYLGIIDARVRASRTGADWQLSSLHAMRGRASTEDMMRTLTSAMIRRQEAGTPVHEWAPADLSEGALPAEHGGWKHKVLKVEQYMTTDLFTVGEEETVDLVLHMMDWRKIRHVLVEDDRHQLVGLISYRSLFRKLIRGEIGGQDSKAVVADVMKRDPVTIAPGATTLEAIETMRERHVGCLPVVDGNQLVGVITERDLMTLAAELLEAQLKPAPSPA